MFTTYTTKTAGHLMLSTQYIDRYIKLKQSVIIHASALGPASGGLDLAIMNFAVIATLMVLATTSAWFASAKPLLPLPSAEISSQEHENAFVKIMNAFANLRVIKEQVQVGPGIDEEKINEQTGIATSPHMYGDLLLTPEQEKLLNIDEGGVAQGFLNGIRFWPNSIVPYELDFRLNSMARREINNAIRDFVAKTCISFERRTQQNRMHYPNFVYFTSGDRGCFSYLGMIGGRQTVNIGRGCEYKGIVQHEILHALGRVHEQSRPDRDQYVIINKNNIIREYRHNFNIHRADTALPYDYGSIMHYGAYDFSSNGQATIRTRQPARIGQRDRLSMTDWRHLQRAYCQRNKA